MGRDLDMDLDRLAREYQTQVLVCLLQDDEFEELEIQGLVPAAEARGWDVLRLPIRDVSVPDDPAAVAKVIASVIEKARQGSNVVIHCKGGLGRAGTIGACVLVASGDSPAAAMSNVREARAGAIESREQEAFIKSFALWLLRSRVLGCVLGAAVGDAMGHPTEFLRSFEAIRRKYPPTGLTGFALYWERDGARFAPYTDDTQMAEVVLRTLIRARRDGADLDRAMQWMAEGFVEWSRNPQGGHRAPGNACLAGCDALAAGAHWSEAGGAKAGGCGSVMRAYPFGLVFAGDPDRAEEWAVQHSKLTHRDPIALAACAAMARGVALTLCGEGDDVVMKAMVDAARRHSPRTAGMIEQAIQDGQGGVPPEIALSRLEGWAAHEAIAAAAYVVTRHPRDPRAAILEAANTPGDSDSIATLVGAVLGARCGLAALPDEWVNDVERSAELRALAEEAVGVMV